MHMDRDATTPGDRASRQQTCVTCKRPSTQCTEVQQKQPSVLPGMTQPCHMHKCDQGAHALGFIRLHVWVALHGWQTQPCVLQALLEMVLALKLGSCASK